MLRPGQSAALLLLILGGLADPGACGLDHCPRPKAREAEAPSLSWSLAHKRLGGESGAGRYTEGALHLRRPVGSTWRLGAHLPFGYLEASGAGHWGMGNPMIYAEAAWGPPPAGLPSRRLAYSAGLQAMLPFGDEASGIASGHAMAMPYLAATLHGGAFVASASAGLAARLSGSHGHGGASADPHAGHSPAAHAAFLDAAPAGTDPVANPHAPYELLYRAGLSLPLPAWRLEPEVAVSGARVLRPEDRTAARDHLTGAAALGLRAGRGILVKPRWEQRLTRPGRLSWSGGLDVKLDLPAGP